MELETNKIFDDNNQTADTNENVVGMENENWHDQLYSIIATKDAEVNNPAKKELDEYKSIQALKNSEKLLEEIKKEQPPNDEENAKGFFDYANTVADTFDSIFRLGGAKDQGVMLALYEAGVMSGDVVEAATNFKSKIFGGEPHRMGLPTREDIDNFRKSLDAGNKAFFEQEGNDASPMVFNITRELTGIITPAVPVYMKLTKVPYWADKLGKLSKPIAMIVAEAVGSVFGLNPKDPNLGNLGQQYLDDGAIKAIADMIAHPAPEDGEEYKIREIYRNKLLDMAEVAGIGAAFEVLFPVIKAAVKYKKTIATIGAGATTSMAHDAEAKAKSLKELLTFFDNTKTEGILKEPRLDVEDTVLAARQFPNMREWYKVHKPIVDEIFGADAQLFEDLLSITSQRAEVGGQNIDNALKAYKAIKNKTPIDDLPMLDGIKDNLKRYVGEMESAKGSMREIDKKLPSGIGLGKTTYLGGKKIGDFMEAVRGLDVAVIDGHMAKIFYNTSKPNKTQVRAIKDIINKAAKKLGWTDSETQAAVWALDFVRQGTDINDIDSYATAIKRKREEIENIIKQVNPDQSAGTGGTVVNRNQPQIEGWGDTIRTSKDGKGTVRSFEPDTGTGTKTQTFFSNVTKGTKYTSDVPYKTVLKLENIKDYVDVRASHRGNFDDHISKSIPAYDDVQNVVGAAIVKTYKNADVLDIGASEGSWGKAISQQSDGKVKTVSLDMNKDMQNNFNSISQVDGATFDLSAFGSNYKPNKKFDVIHEGMLFQFISSSRNAQVKEVKRLLKKDGVFVTEEKFITNDYRVNEFNKDNYKSYYFTKDQLVEKAKKIVLSGGLDEAEGMMGNQVTIAEMNKVLKGNFKFVVQFWDSGNFKGFAASDNKKKLDSLIKNMEDTHSEYSTVRTPKKL